MSPRTHKILNTISRRPVLNFSFLPFGTLIRGLTSSCYGDDQQMEGNTGSRILVVSLDVTGY